MGGGGGGGSNITKCEKMKGYKYISKALYFTIQSCIRQIFIVKLPAFFCNS